MVTESACFCFLTDRRYFEEIRQRAALAPYSTQYTYFSNQLFVAFRQESFHHYLAKVLQKPNIPPNPSLWYPSTTSTTVSAEQREVSKRAAEELDDFSVLPYILLHAAQMHPIDLRREIAGLRGPDGNVVLAPRALCSGPRYNLELLIQVAIEFILEEENMKRELERQPAFRRLAHDAVYYLTRSWDSAEEELFVGRDKGERNFSIYLIQRIVSMLPAESGPDERLEVTDMDRTVRIQEQSVGPSDPIDQQFLWSCVLQLAELLANPQNILKQAEKKRLPGDNPRRPTDSDRARAAAPTSQKEKQNRGVSLAFPSLRSAAPHRCLAKTDTAYGDDWKVRGSSPQN